MKPTPLNLPTVADLFTLTFRLLAAQLLVGIVLAVPISIVWIALVALAR